MIDLRPLRRRMALQSLDLGSRAENQRLGDATTVGGYRPRRTRLLGSKSRTSEKKILKLRVLKPISLIESINIYQKVNKIGQDQSQPGPTAILVINHVELMR